MGRTLTSHRVNGLNESIEIMVLDQPGPGGACHTYRLTASEGQTAKDTCIVHFQQGPISEGGVNGVSQESLLAIVEDRLVGFQSGAYACRENAIALTHIQEAMMWLQRRTRDRLARGVEGTSKK